jgi:hypothetical protein
VSMVAVGGNVLLEPWRDARQIDSSALSSRQVPSSHRSAQKFAEVDGIKQLPRYPALKPFHGPVLAQPSLWVQQSGRSVATLSTTTTAVRLTAAAARPALYRLPPRATVNLETFNLRRHIARMARSEEEEVRPMGRWSEALHSAHHSIGAKPLHIPSPPARSPSVRGRRRQGGEGGGGGGGATAAAASASAVGVSPRAAGRLRAHYLPAGYSYFSPRVALGLGSTLEGSSGSLSSIAPVVDAATSSRRTTRSSEHLLLQEFHAAAGRS